MKIVEEFKTFIAKGNVVDMAVGIITGTAFTKIVNSLVADIVTPILGIILGKINLQSLELKINDSVSVTYGNFIQAVIDFLIIAVIIFIMVKGINSIKAKFEKKEEAEEVKEEPKPTNEELLLSEIRDLLKQQNN